MSDLARPAPALSPMTRFGPDDAPRILAHLLTLDTDDRMLRFGHGIRDEGLASYVARLDYVRDHVHGLNDARGDIVALAHIAMHDGDVDFGLSVTRPYRGQGLGHALFSHVIAMAQRGGAARVLCYSISPAVLHMAGLHGFRRSGGNPAAPLALQLPSPAPASLSRSRAAA